MSPVHPLDSWRQLRQGFRDYAQLRAPEGDEIPFFHLEWSAKLPGGFPAGAWRGLRKAWERIVRQFGMPDLVHAHVGFPAGWLACRIKDLAGIPYVLTEHMGPFPFPSMVKKGRLMPELVDAYREASRIIAVSPALAADIRRWGLADRVEVIPNLVDEQLFFPAKSKDRHPFVFFFLGLLGSQKGADVLLRAIARWRPPADVKFVLAGQADKHQVAAFMKEARRLKVVGAVEWVGRLSRREVAHWMRRANVFVLPSRHESFGVVLVEALACGTPVISTRCGGPEFIVRDDRVGRLVDVGDEEALAQALQDFYFGYDRFDSREIYRFFKEHFSSEAIAQRLADTYAKALGAFR
ncbi:MAG: glycosyltransferase family 4 protein [Calditrichaeota bacterium]|nr:MAG: glycosyltransferase family 4 protein [Calditrichota bacterium]